MYLFVQKGVRWGGSSLIWRGVGKRRRTLAVDYPVVVNVSFAVKSWFYSLSKQCIVVELRCTYTTRTYAA
jgi:hypothetical protein